MDQNEMIEKLAEALRGLINLNGPLTIFTGNANVPLAEKVSQHLNCNLGKATVSFFSDRETKVEINQDVRGTDVFIIQPVCMPANDSLMELLILLDALKRASARRITAVMPYYGYARQDRKVMPRAPISAKLVADLLTVAGANRILCIDLHAGQIQGFFNIPGDNIFARPVLTNYLANNFKDPVVIVSPDAGGVERARNYAKILNVALAIIDKRREKPNDLDSIIMNILGDVQGLTAILVDDMVDTAGTLCGAATALKEKGAEKVIACCIHPVLSGKAIDNIQKSPIEKLIVTDTIPLSPEAIACPKIEVVSIAPLLAEAIKKIHNDDSVSSLF